MALLISLITIVISKEKPTSSYSYGLERLEVVAAFSNGALLIFVGLYIGFEAVEHLFEPPEEVDMFVEVK
jgi:cobalt-zinc-cadmium efflux system protein